MTAASTSTPALETTAALPPATRRTVRRGDISLAVFSYGDPNAETVILVHGWPDTHHLWTEIVPLLADRYHVVSYDTRGHGESTKPKGWRPFVLAEFAQDFFAVADAVSPDRPVHALAHDWGSVALWEAVCEPGAELRIASFTSVSGPNLDFLGSWARSRLSRPTPRNLIGPLQQAAASGYTVFFQTPIVPKVVFTLAGRPAIWKRFVARVEGTDPSHIHLADTFTKDMVSGLRIYRANILSRLHGPRDRRTSVPVQLIINRNDIAVRPAGYVDYGKYTGDLYRRDLLAGHWSPFSHPQALADATRDLVESVRSGEPSRELRRARARAESMANPTRPKRKFTDQLVVITGAGSGIGRETALAFAREGAELVVCDINLASAKQTSALIADVGGEAHAYELDVSNEAAVVAFAETVRDRHGVPDVLVNNAGIGHAGRFLDTSSEQFQRVLDVNLNGVVYGCRAFARQMVDRAQGGHIVNISSLAAFTPQRAMGPYATSKSGVYMFSDVLRAELAEYGIGVSTIFPGIVHTNITKTTTFSGVSAEEQERRQQKFDRLYRMRRYTPDKVANQIVKAVVKKRDLVPVTPESHYGWVMSRFAPGLTRRFARADLIR